MYHPRFKGNHYEIGLKYGGLLKKNNIDLFGLTELDDFQFNYGIQSERILRKCFPEACEEIRGMTDGVGVPYQRFSAWLMCISVCLEIPGCSMIAFKKVGKVLFGRNNDLPPIFRKISSSALYAPSNGYSFIANSSAFVSAEDGINEKGLAVGMTYVWAKELKAGFSSMFFIRYILEKCATVEEGLKAIQNIPIGGAYHLILADKNEIVHVECSPQKIKINRGDFAVASNHFVSEEMKKYEEAKNLYCSNERYKTGYDALSKGFDKVAVGYAKDILSGKLGFMCQYDKELNFDTVWSSVFDISNNKIYRAEGNPSRTRFKEDIRFNRGVLKEKNEQGGRC
jgi:predicted choloylglycine hydrolase